MNPDLPVELIKEIFGIVISNSNDEIHSANDRNVYANKALLAFVRVSRTWQGWAEPILYRTVVLHDEIQLEGFLSTLEKRSTSVSRLVRHMTLALICHNPTSKYNAKVQRETKTSAAITAVLAACYALESLAVHPSVLPFTLELPEDVTLSCLPSSFSFFQPQAIAPQPAYSAVKLLRLQASPFSLETIIEILISFNSLTHVAIDFPRERAGDRNYLLAFYNVIRHLLRSREMQVVCILVHCLGVRIAFDVILAGLEDERLIAVELSGKDARNVRDGRSSVWTVVDKAIHDV